MNNNGNLRGATWSNGGPGYASFLTFNQSFGYDGVNRLTSATDSGGWSSNFGFDAFGNMWVSGWSGIAPAGNMAQSNVYNANNQVSGGTYDQAGDQTNVGGNTLNYDYEGHVVAEIDGVSKAVEIYVYDGDGHRVKKYVKGGSARTVFVYDARGLLAAEYSTTANSSPCLTCYLSPDHLGTARLVTDQNGNVVARHDYLPFGEEIAASTAGRDGSFGPGNDSVRQKFTGKERDSESGLDYFGARYYGSSMGRFMSPDEPVDQHPEDPQSWNLYSYVRNNPLTLTDPTGDYACGRYVTAAQCTAFGNYLTQAQSVLDKGKAAGTIDSDQYKAGTKALAAYGTLNDGNGVTVNVGATGGFPGTTVAEGGREKTAANPAGQDIQVTLNGKLFDQGSSPSLLGAIAHEGSHVEDAEV